MIEDSWGAGTFITGGDNRTGTSSGGLLRNSLLERAQEGTDQEDTEKVGLCRRHACMVMHTVIYVMLVFVVTRALHCRPLQIDLAGGRRARKSSSAGKTKIKILVCTLTPLTTLVACTQITFVTHSRRLLCAL